MAVNGTAVGSPTYAAGAAGFGQAIVLDGSTQYVSFSGVGPFDVITANSSWAISLRFKTAGGAGQYVMAASRLTGVGAVFYLTVQAGNLNCYIDGFGNLTSGVAVGDNAWHTLLIQVIDGKRATMWLDGTRSTTVDGTATGLVGDIAWIGGYTSAALYFPGSLQDVAVYPNALYPPYRNYVPATVKLATTPLYRSLYQFDGNVNDTAVAYTAVAYSDANIIYSPYNWGASANSNGKVSQSPGSYLRAMFTGTKAFLLFDNYATIDNSTDPPLVGVRIDGGNWNDYRATGIVDVTPVALGNYRHYIEVLLLSYDDNERWGTSTTDPRSAIVFKGLYISSGGVTRAPTARPFNMLVYGDSISQGTDVNGSGGANTVNDDSRKAWPFAFAQSPTFEVGVVAYNGIAIDGTAHTITIGPLKDTWNYQKNSLARLFSPAPNVIVLLMGQNDDAGTEAAVIASFTTILQGLVGVAPAAKIICLGPLSQLQATSIAAAVAAVGNANVTYVSTVGWMPGFTSLDSSDTVHPYASDEVGLIAAKVAPYAFNAIAPANSNKGVLSRRGLRG
jgi:hypothetical protein